MLMLMLMIDMKQDKVQKNRFIQITAAFLPKIQI